MNAFFGIGIISAIVYSIMVDATYLKIYALLLIGYILLTQLGTLNRYNNGRKKCNIATWNGTFLEQPCRPEQPSDSSHLRMGSAERREISRKEAKRNGASADDYPFGWLLRSQGSSQPA